MVDVGKILVLERWRQYGTIVISGQRHGLEERDAGLNATFTSIFVILVHFAASSIFGAPPVGGMENWRRVPVSNSL